MKTKHARNAYKKCYSCCSDIDYPNAADDSEARNN